MITRKKVVRLPGQPKKPRTASGGSIDPPADAPDSSMMIASGRWGASKYWQLRLDEIDKYGEVRVYGPEGTLVKTIPTSELARPMPIRQGQTWNNYLFLDRRD